MPSVVPTVEEEIIKEVAAEMDLSYKQARDIIINGQGAFTKHVMESGMYNSVRWPYLGTFRVKIKRMQIRKYMEGLLPIYRHIYRQQIKHGYIFPSRYKAATEKVNFYNKRKKK